MLYADGLGCRIKYIRASGMHNGTKRHLENIEWVSRYPRSTQSNRPKPATNKASLIKLQKQVQKLSSAVNQLLLDEGEEGGREGGEEGGEEEEGAEEGEGLVGPSS